MKSVNASHPGISDRPGNSIALAKVYRRRYGPVPASCGIKRVAVGGAAGRTRTVVVAYSPFKIAERTLDCTALGNYKVEVFPAGIAGCSLDNRGNSLTLGYGPDLSFGSLTCDNCLNGFKFASGCRNKLLVALLVVFGYFKKVVLGSFLVRKVSLLGFKL